jgi:hypothetical protein
VEGSVEKHQNATILLSKAYLKVLDKVLNILLTCVNLSSGAVLLLLRSFSGNCQSLAPWLNIKCQHSANYALLAIDQPVSVYDSRSGPIIFVFAR